jgi:hypothetical protein
MRDEMLKPQQMEQILPEEDAAALQEIASTVAEVVNQCEEGIETQQFVQIRESLRSFEGVLPNLIMRILMERRTKLNEFQQRQKWGEMGPLFGEVLPIDNKLAFVLMPFIQNLTAIYEFIVKPTVESAGLNCHRADDFRDNRTIMQDVWEGICKARVVVADLTTFNANVMYELGIAHTLW